MVPVFWPGVDFHPQDGVFCAFLSSSTVKRGYPSVRSHVCVAKDVGFMEPFGQILGGAENSGWMEKPGRSVSMSGIV